MTDETDFDVDDARDAARTIQGEATEAEDSLFQGPDHQQIESALDKVESAAHEIANQANYLNEGVGELAGSAHSSGVLDLSRGADEAIENIQVVQDRARVIAEVLQTIEESDDDVSTTTVTLGAKEYEVRFEETGYVGDETFSEWLSALREEEPDLTLSKLERGSLVSETRLKAILEGGSPNGDEGPSILKMLREAGYITEEQRQSWADALEQ